MRPLAPVHTAALFPPLHAELMRLLRGLSPDDWNRPTVSPRWSVRDVAAHLLDGDLRKLSTTRDGYVAPPDREIGGYADLVDFLNDLNEGWVRAARRLSPRVLADLLEMSGTAVSAMVAALPPHEPSVFAVDWAGEPTSENWMDTGREMTERWHHQMQIREAVGAIGLTGPEWMGPVLDVSVRALRRAYAGVDAAPGTVVSLRVGEPARTWSVVADAGGWRVMDGAGDDAAASVWLDEDTAWRMFYNALPRETLRNRARVEGDSSLAEPLFTARAVMV